ncbi:hypothetical protein [Aneurinibacillus danicus]|uniref:Uncharacterized protein n=1 Tax=Aneurinibacillus danicus TaxID=267746 RepID=A0A511V8A5_9BACL|nr:hypothetical protein [Aneurinibacillus danicus]GEN35110.1 hypothetical protein ADA01nite_25700 [Aneurinibacillus danicus]
MTGQQSHELILNQLSDLQKEVKNIRLTFVGGGNIPGIHDNQLKIKRLGSRPSKIERLGASERVVDMYNQGYTLREIADAISSNQIRVSHVSVRNFIQKVRNASS